MRWGNRALTVLTAVLLAAGGCSGTDDGTAGAAARATSTSTTSTSTSSTSTTPTSTSAPGATVAAPPRAPAPSGAATTRTSRAAVPTTTVTTAATTTTTRPRCLATAAGSAPSFGSADPEDTAPATVHVGNQHASAVVIGLRGATYTLPPGGTQQLTLPPLHQPETMTAAPASDPGDRFSYSVHLLPGRGYTINVKTMDVGTCNAAGVRQAVYLRQDGFQS